MSVLPLLSRVLGLLIFRSPPNFFPRRYLFAPIAWPIAKFLDWVLGANEEHVSRFFSYHPLSFTLDTGAELTCRFASALTL
jgi:hypothetical protein